MWLVASQLKIRPGRTAETHNNLVLTLTPSRRKIPSGNSEDPIACGHWDLKRKRNYHMARTGKDWTREEHILAFNLYCKIPFGQVHTSDNYR